jgi:MFS family permease
LSSTVVQQRTPRSSTVAGRTFSSLRRRNYRLWFFGQTVSQSGTWMQSVAQMALVLFHLHGSALDLGITAALQFGPVLVLGPFGGLLADRFDKRKLLLATQTAFTAQALALGILVATGSARLWMVWALAFVMGAINSVDNPARQSFLVELVGPEDLANAVGLNSVTNNASRIVGPAIAGILIVTVGMSWTFMLNAASFFAVLAALWAMRSSDLHRLPPVARAKGQIREGLRYAWGTWQLRVPLLMVAVIGTLAYNFSVILPLFAHVFHRGAGTYSAMTTAMGVGALIGALAAAARRRPGYRLLVLVTSAFGVFIAAVAAAPSLPLMLLLMVPMGTASVLFIATANSLLQLHSSDAMRGRVMALWAMVFLGSTPIGGPLTGVAVAHFGVRLTMAFGGVATLLTAAAAGFALRRIRGEGRAARAVAAREARLVIGAAGSSL